LITPALYNVYMNVAQRHVVEGNKKNKVHKVMIISSVTIYIYIILCFVTSNIYSL
jgi:hypothetical protein